MRRFFIVLLIFVPLAIQANNYSVLAKEAEQNQEEQIQQYFAIANDAKKQAAAVTEVYKNKIVNSDVKFASVEDINLNKSKNNYKVIVFISFSMPDKSIVSTLQNANKIQASVVIRGLIHNSFKDTLVRMASIVKEAGGGGVELNPPVFKKFNIQKVPAFVVLPSHDTCQSEKICEISQFDVVYGDIPLNYALNSIRDHGDVSRKNAEQLVLKMDELNHV